MQNEIDGNKHEEVHADDHASTSSSLGQSSVNHVLLLCDEMTGKYTVQVAFSQQLAPAPDNLQNDLDDNIPEKNCRDLGLSILCCDDNNFLGNEATNLCSGIQHYAVQNIYVQLKQLMQVNVAMLFLCGNTIYSVTSGFPLVV